MNIKKIMTTILTFGLLSLSLFDGLLVAADEMNEPYTLAIDYELISKAEPQEIEQLSELEIISNIEIFYWYGCEPCYQVEAAIDVYLLQNPEVSVRRTPIIARSGWRAQAYIQPLMLQLAELDNLPKTTQIYQQCLNDCKAFNDFPAILTWFSETLEIEKLPIIDEETIWQQEKNYQKRADLFSIAQVPTIIINETYQVNANQAKTSKRLVEIIDFLLTK